MGGKKKRKGTPSPFTRTHTRSTRREKEREKYAPYILRTNKTEEARSGKQQVAYYRVTYAEYRFDRQSLHFNATELYQDASIGPQRAA